MDEFCLFGDLGKGLVTTGLHRIVPKQIIISGESINYEHNQLDEYFEIEELS